ncbi:MAG: hypothetical protein Q7T96_09860 [Methylobacter sp.]|nr:hypothetical protein [Methylobacter sp.]
MTDEISEFDELTKQRIKVLFAEKFKQKQPEADWQFLELEANIFLITLQDWGLSMPEFEQINPPKQQKRRETIKSMGSALLRCVNQFAALDSGARGYACFRGVEEISNTIGKPNLFPDEIPSSLFVHAHKDDVINELRAFAKGVLKAADELPEKPEPPIELRIALFIERLFWEQDFEFTTSQTSFAAECLRAVLALGGIHKDRVDYWLTEARNHQDSMASMLMRLQKANEKSH